eukprot:scaffold406_cov391-Prasinococcus_capsulatus_cf.AAC.15
MRIVGFVRPCGQGANMPYIRNIREHPAAEADYCQQSGLQAFDSVKNLLGMRRRLHTCLQQRYQRSA